MELRIKKLEAEIKYMEIKTSFAVNYVEGDENHPRSQSSMGEDYQKALDYPLNQMKDFSHFRMQIKYSF